MKALAKTSVAIEILKSKCEDVDSPSEADVIVSLLENIMDDYDHDIRSLAAPETNVLKKIAIIRTPDLKLNLINPTIIAAENRILSFNEPCASFSGITRNCFRYDTIFITNGFSKEVIQFKGQNALLIQHAIDHLNGVIYHDRTIKFAVVRNGGKILGKDVCPCGSKKRFSLCCLNK